MSAQIIPLQPEASAAQSNKPNKHDRDVIEEYLQISKSRGFCKIDDASSNFTRLYNRRNGKTLPVSFIENNFIEWLEETGKDCNFTSGAYIMRGLPHIIGPIFKPVDKEFIFENDTGCRYANTYRRYQPTADNAEVSPLFVEFFERLFPNERERHIVLQWLAHMFQRPEQRPSWHLMLISQPGLGKGFLVQEILHPLLHHTSVVASYSRVMGQFSAVITENLLILLDDCKSKSEATQTQLKSLLSEERAYVERKHAQGGMENTYARFILASNEAVPLYLDPSERRWFIPADLVHRVDRQETQALIQSLADWLACPGSLCNVYNWFMSYPLDGFNHKSVPESDGLSRLVSNSKSPYLEFLEGYISENTVFTYAEMKEAFKTEGHTPPGDTHLKHLLEDVGYEKTKTRLADGERPWLWHHKGMPSEDIRAAYADDAPAQSDQHSPPF